MSKTMMLAIGGAGCNMSETIMREASIHWVCEASYLFADSDQSRLAELAKKRYRTVDLNKAEISNEDFKGVEKLYIVAGLGGKTGSTHIMDAIMAARGAGVQDISAIVTVGNKRVGIGAYKTIPGATDAAHAFIKHDIKYYDLNYWVEVSGPIETLCKKYNGYPIPNIYVPIILNSSDINMSDDGFHYSRIISGDDMEKCMYGFSTNNIYNIIMNDMGKIYDDFRKNVNALNESFNIEHMPMQLKKALAVYEMFWELHFEQGYAEISNKLYSLLVKAVNIIKNNDYKYSAYLGDTPEDILGCFTVIIIHKF